MFAFTCTSTMIFTKFNFYENNEYISAFWFHQVVDIFFEQFFFFRIFIVRDPLGESLNKFRIVFYLYQLNIF